MNSGSNVLKLEFINPLNSPERENLHAILMGSSPCFYYAILCLSLKCVCFGRQNLVFSRISSLMFHSGWSIQKDQAMNEKEKKEFYVAMCRCCLIAEAMKGCGICPFNIGLVEQVQPVDAIPVSIPARQTEPLVILFDLA